MLLILLVIVLVGLLGWVYSQWRRARSHWAQCGVPHLPPHPIMGSLTFLQKVNPGEWMRDMYFKFRFPYFGIWLFWRPALVVNCPELARRILVKDSDVFRDRFLRSGQTDPIGGLNLFTVKDPTWSSVRRRLTPVFTAAKLRALNGLTSKKSEELVQRIRNDNEMKQRTDLRKLFSNYTIDVIGSAAFGVAGEATLTDAGPLKKVTDDIMTFSVHRGLSWSSIFFFPELVDIFGFSFYPKSTTAYFRKIFYAMVDQRGGFDKEPEVNDLLDALLKIKREAVKDNRDFSDDLIISQAAIFLQGGFDTTAVVISLVVYHLAYYPEIQERVYQFLMTWRDADGQDSPAGVTYLDCVVSEVLRLYPAMGWLDRITSKPYKVDDTLTIPAGTPVYINGIGMHVDPNYFPDPYKFDPDRFLPENEKNIKPFTYLPFGDGPRNCIGKRFAQQSLRYALSAVITSYEVSPLPGRPKPSDIRIEKRNMFLMPEDLLYVDFVPRCR